METKQLDTLVSQTAVKLRLEATFARELFPLFTALRRDFTATVRAIGQSPDAESYTPRFRSALQNHYTRVQRQFRGALDIEHPDNVESMIDFSLLTWRDENAEQKADFITATNQRQMDQSIQLGRQSLQEQQEPVTPNGLALASGAILFNRFFRSRPALISQTETQEAAEATKLIDAEAAAGRVPFPIRGRIIPPTIEERAVEKTWDTVGDDRVRPSHAAVNGMTLAENGVFLVGGSRLRFPGDTGLGASVGEVINCRCSSRYEVA